MGKVPLQVTHSLAPAPSWLKSRIPRAFVFPEWLNARIPGAGPLELEWVRREKNAEADHLANYALDSGDRTWEFQ